MLNTSQVQTEVIVETGRCPFYQWRDTTLTETDIKMAEVRGITLNEAQIQKNRDALCEVKVCDSAFDIVMTNGDCRTCPEG